MFQPLRPQLASYSINGQNEYFYMFNFCFHIACFLKKHPIAIEAVEVIEVIYVFEATKAVEVTTEACFIALICHNCVKLQRL